MCVCLCVCVARIARLRVRRGGGTQRARRTVAPARHLLRLAAAAAGHLREQRAASHVLQRQHRTEVRLLRLLLHRYHIIIVYFAQNYLIQIAKTNSNWARQTSTSTFILIVLLICEITYRMMLFQPSLSILLSVDCVLHSSCSYALFIFMCIFVRISVYFVCLGLVVDIVFL